MAGGIMEKLFGGFATTQPSQQTTQPSGVQQQPGTTPGNMPTNAGATSPTNSTVPAGSDPATQQQQDPTGLDQFKDLWTAPTGSDGKPLPTNSGALPPVDPNKIMEAAKKANFANAIPKEVFDKIQAGGADANTAFVQAMNTVAQTVYAQSAMATTKIVEQALKKQQESFEGKLPSIIKQHSVRDNLRQENPLFSNPAVQPIISALEVQLATKYPQATATELTQMAQQYVAGLGTAFSPAKANTNVTSGKPGETDWSNFLE